LDKFSTSYVFYPFESSSTSYTIVFVDDLPSNVVHTATVSICSSRLLVPANVIDPLNDSTREIVHAVASQWLGVKLVAKSARDSWIIVGGAYFMADQFMMGLWGKNEHRYRLKRAADKIHSMDVRRPSIYDMGAYVDLDPAEYEFLKLKATAIFHILHHRIIKAYGRNGVDRIMYRVLLDDNLGKIDGSEVDTDRLIRSTEKVAHFKVDTFFHQWVYGAGCPSFSATQKFNKKKLVVEILLKQTQASDLSPDLNEDSFLRELKEREHAMKTPAAQPLFTGPMTIRIHEADGTPYEHIVDIKEVTTKIDIPYYTKYKRLKRNRRQKERAAAMTGIETNGEAQDDVLVYCLGDVLQSEDEVREWELEDWSKEDEEKMSNEHFEWIRVDKDFEWIAKIAFNQPHYMWVSQLQQDNDVVAQVESIDYLMGQVPHHLISTILTRTLMDSRYFYGIRVLAARALASNALAQLNWIGLKHLFKAFQALFCIEKTTMTRSNDFSNFASYYIQCAIVDAIAMVREPSGRSPEKVKQFFIEKLKFNDNSSNAYSDAFYVAKLMAAAVQTLVSTKPRSAAVEDYEQDVRDTETQRAAVEEVQRYRRMDEWIPSHQNIYTVTALDGMRLLMQNGIPGLKIADMMGYTRPGNSNFVRTKAFECLVDVGAFSNAHIMAFFIVSFYNERSPYMRDRIWDVICRAFGRMALAEPARQSQPHGGLVIDDADTSQHAQARTIGGASAMLRAKAGSETVLQGVIMEALR
jgi:transcription initiation factor TFIID subunit 2